MVGIRSRSLYRSKNQTGGGCSGRRDGGKGVKRAEKGAERPPRERGSDYAVIKDRRAAWREHAQEGSKRSTDINVRMRWFSFFFFFF